MGRVVSFKLNSQNPEEAAAFYGKVFGWEVAVPNWDYWAVTTGNEEQTGINGGIGKGPSDYPHGTWIQIGVDAMDEIIAQAKKNRATILCKRMEFDDLYLAYLFGRSNRHRNRFNSI